MKITVKTLAQKSFVVEIEPTETILELKKKIKEAQQFDVETQKLIYSGKILDNAKTVAECKIEETGFLVVMTPKPKPVAATPAAAPATPVKPSEASSSTPAVAPTPAIAPAAPSAAAAPATSTPSQAAPATPSPAGAATTGPFDASTLATGSAYDSAVANLLEMGFPRDQIVRAMRAAFNNPDRAAEYLMTGIPENLAREMAPQGAAPTSAAPAPATPATPAQPAAAAGTDQAAQGQFINLFEAAAQAAQQQQGGGGAGANPAAGLGGLGLGAGAEGADGANALAFLRNNPQFQQLRQLVQTQPQFIQPLMQQLAQTQPQLMQLIAQNQDAFFQLLGEGEGGEGVGDEEGAGGPGGGAQYISVTPEEEAAINRLVALGFDRQMAIEAFFACDKNEELAANYLFEAGGEGW
ncbi:hypothetical protein HDU87_006790 [Geranomyces variabilis]|uniref:UV excision repair protein RAD23 n=1 Tax=Geranomyces variabilis TaxID=109894 RepID=A0AAD5XTV6_9FUNG|nr:hypothetical protein HDU87_006790 [Geranomyces variabilis]